MILNNIDSIIHCAAKVGGIGANINKPGEFFYGNIIMNTNLLEAARVAGVKKVVSFMSTCVFPSNAAHPLSPEQINSGEPHMHMPREWLILWERLIENNMALTL